MPFRHQHFDAADAHQVGHKALPDDEGLLSLPFVADSDIYFMPRRKNKQLVFGSVAHRFESEIVVTRPDEVEHGLGPRREGRLLGLPGASIADPSYVGAFKGSPTCTRSTKTTFIPS